jgi:hypothetical protein
MSALPLQPATWPTLALNPEPSMDPEGIERWYLELFRDDQGAEVTG